MNGPRYGVIGCGRDGIVVDTHAQPIDAIVWRGPYAIACEVADRCAVILAGDTRPSPFGDGIVHWAGEGRCAESWRDHGRTLAAAWVTCVACGRGMDFTADVIGRELGRAIVERAR